MFENLNWWEIGALLLIALLIFGDRLPNAISDGLRMVRNLRNMARNATEDLSRELGTDIQLEDLHPKTLLRKHLLSEEDEAALRKPLQGIYDSVRSDLSSVQQELKDVASAVDPRSIPRTAISKDRAGATSVGTSSPSAGTSSPPAQLFDTDAT